MEEVLGHPFFTLREEELHMDPQLLTDQFLKGKFSRHCTCYFVCEEDVDGGGDDAPRHLSSSLLFEEVVGTKSIPVSHEHFKRLLKSVVPW
jgi:hypothetical protein